jgi:glycosyltransferase involved in cell wall biosynthesis
MPARYRALDLMLLTSWHEGTPLAILEAMACGVPVVATDVGGVAELIVSGTTGALVPPGDDAQMAGRACELLASRAMLARMGERAREHVRARFSIDEQVRATGALLRDVAQGANQSAGAGSTRAFITRAM